MTTTTKIDYTDLPRNADADDVRDAVARALDAAGYLVTDTYGQPSKPATYWGERSWHSTPFQCADTDAEGVAAWLASDSGIGEGEIGDYIDISEVTGDDIAVDLPDDVSEMDDDDLQRAVALARWARKNDIDTDDLERFVAALRAQAAELEKIADELE